MVYNYIKKYPSSVTLIRSLQPLCSITQCSSAITVIQQRPVRCVRHLTNTLFCFENLIEELMWQIRPRTTISVSDSRTACDLPVHIIQPSHQFYSQYGSVSMDFFFIYSIFHHDPQRPKNVVYPWVVNMQHTSAETDNTVAKF